jgi:hypothetical protein
MLRAEYQPHAPGPRTSRASSSRCVARLGCGIVAVRWHRCSREPKRSTERGAELGAVRGGRGRDGTSPTGQRAVPIATGTVGRSPGLRVRARRACLRACAACPVGLPPVSVRRTLWQSAASMCVQRACSSAALPLWAACSRVRSVLAAPFSPEEADPRRRATEPSDRDIRDPGPRLEL